MSVVVFDADEFRAAHPQFTEDLITDAQLESAFDAACLIIDNTDSSVIPYDPDNDITTRKVLLYLLVCHIAALSLWPVGQSGPTSSASEGSVSASFSVPDMDSGYFSLTPCGRIFWLTVQRYLIGGRYYAAKQVHPWG